MNYERELKQLQERLKNAVSIVEEEELEKKIEILKNWRNEQLSST